MAHDNHPIEGSDDDIYCEMAADGSAICYETITVGGSINRPPGPTSPSDPILVDSGYYPGGGPVLNQQKVELALFTRELTYVTNEELIAIYYDIDAGWRAIIPSSPNYWHMTAMHEAVT